MTIIILQKGKAWLEYHEKVKNLTIKHHNWRGNCINLIPAEKITSPTVQSLMCSDLGHRYAAQDTPFYGGTRFLEETKKTGEVKPKLVSFGASFIVFLHTVKKLSDVAEEEDTYVAHDGSPVLGLIAGKKFQNPLREDTDLLIASAHRTFPGSRRGIIVDKEKRDRLRCEENAQPI